MKRLIILGSSHCAALKLGWESIASSHPDWDVQFYALPGKTFRKLQINKARAFGMLEPQKIPEHMHEPMREALGGDRIALTDADAVISVGWYLHEAHHADLLANHWIDGFPEPRTTSRRMSLTAYNACLQSLAEHTLPTEAWWNWDTPRLFILPQPRPAQSCLTESDAFYQPWQDFAQAYPDGQPLLSRYTDQVARTLRTVGVELLSPPKTVLHATGLTLQKFARQSPKLGNTELYPETDHHHMNRSYGEIVLKSVFRQITSKLASKE